MQPSVGDRVPNLEHLILQKHLLPGPKTLILLAFCRQAGVRRRSWSYPTSPSVRRYFVQKRRRSIFIRCGRPLLMTGVIRRAEGNGVRTRPLDTSDART